MLKYCLPFLVACASLPAPSLARIDAVQQAVCHEPTEAYVVECLMAAQALDTYERLPTLRTAQGVVVRLEALANAACYGKETPTCQKLVQALADAQALTGLLNGAP